MIYRLATINPLQTTTHRQATTIVPKTLTA